MTKQETIVNSSTSEIGSPYVYGTWGQLCTVALRKRYAGYRPSQKAITYKRCQRLRPSKPVNTCDGCPYKGRLAFDCRGFVHWVMEQAGIEITGQSVGSQWNTKSNWAEQGDIDAMPDLIAVVFIRTKSGKWEHVGIHIGGGRIIHCSGEVKNDVVGGDRRWSHYAIPAGLYTPEEIRKAHEERGTFMRILKKGDQGADVRTMQELLTALGYDVGAKDGKADGIFGPKTESAVKLFQQKNGLDVSGIANMETLELLAARAADPDTPELPEDDDEHDAPVTIVPLSYTEAVTIRDALRKALEIIEKALA